MMPRDSPQLTKQNTSKRTRKNDPTVSICEFERASGGSVLGKPGMTRNRVQIVLMTNSNGISRVRYDKKKGSTLYARSSYSR